MADFLLGGETDPVTHQRTGPTTSIASSDLTTHGVIVGMTGSGKTGLGIVVIEDALRAGIPTLLIDPKGDLTNLCLTFPDLAPRDFEPWVDEGDATEAGLSVADYAVGQSQTWADGLAGWNLAAADIADLRSKVELTIYTPGSAAGVGINIVGSLRAPDGVVAGGVEAVDVEVVGDEIDGFVSGLLGLVGIDADPLTSREHILLSNLILGEWSAGRSLDLAGLIGLVQTPRIRKLGVFDLDVFFPPKDRTAFAIRLNGLLASPGFGGWMSGPPLDIGSMLHTADGRPRCAIVTTAHLDDGERQFATTLVLSKLVTWMRAQSGTTGLRALLYMDEVAGYLPPTAMPPTKKPIMTLMKQARAFGVGVVLSTQNPVDIDYKALSNAGTWMIGRLQTQRDKDRLLDGLDAAVGGVDVHALGDTIAGLAPREFVLRRAGEDRLEVFTTRWAMSYLRGPLTREQITLLMADQRAPIHPVAPPTLDAATTAGPDQTAVMPTVAASIPVWWADRAAPWMATAGGDPRATEYAAAIVARVALRYDDATADLVHDEEYEAVIHPLRAPTDPTAAISIDFDDRDLLGEAPPAITYDLTDAAIDTTAYWTSVRRDLVAHLVRSRPLNVLCNQDLGLYGRPGETAEEFGARCYRAADDRADIETADLRTKYGAKVARLRTQLQNTQDRARVLETEQAGRRHDEVLSTAGSILGGLLRARHSRGGLLGSVLDTSGAAAARRSRTHAAGDRVVAAHNRAGDLSEQMEQLEAELTEEVMDIDTRWNALSKNVTTRPITLEKADVDVIRLSLVWIPVASARNSG